MKRTILVGVMVLGTSIGSQSFGFDLLDRMLGLKGSGCDSTCCDTNIGGGCLEPACGLEAPCGGCVAEPACGLEAPCGSYVAEPACGLEAPCGTCAEPACGCEAPVVDCGCATAAPSCGCETGLCGGGKRHRLLDKLFGGHGCNDGCDSGCEVAACGTCEPACGLEVASDCGCDAGLCGGKGHGGLLKKLFGHLHRNNSDCCEIGCDVAAGCSSCVGGQTVAPTMAPAVNNAPAQEVSPMPPAPVVDPSAYLHSKRRVIQASTHYTR